MIFRFQINDSLDDLIYKSDLPMGTSEAYQSPKELTIKGLSGVSGRPRRLERRPKLVFRLSQRGRLILDVRQLAFGIHSEETTVWKERWG